PPRLMGYSWGFLLYRVDMCVPAAFIVLFTFSFVKQFGFGVRKSTVCATMIAAHQRGEKETSQEWYRENVKNCESCNVSHSKRHIDSEWFKTQGKGGNAPDEAESFDRTYTNVHLIKLIKKRGK
ncbi:MAG: hypothetical protein RR065_11390, partial [Clostridia bacterium]